MKSYSQTETNIIINFSTTYPKNRADLLSSSGFTRLLDSYIKDLSAKDDLTIEKLKLISDDILADLTNIFKLLISFDLNEVSNLNKKYNDLIQNKDLVLEVVEGLYNYWRHFERYAIVRADRGIEGMNFIEETNKFTDLVLSTYRIIEAKLLEYKPNVYRQLQAGINVGIMISDNSTQFNDPYKKLQEIKRISQIIIRPPFICYTKKNTRKGVFNEIKNNPLRDISFDPSHWLLYPALVGDCLIHIYFHRSYMDHGVALANLFELEKDVYSDKKPCAIYFFGDKTNAYPEPCYYNDEENDMVIGYAPYKSDFDYFGYMKKMVLTLHNLIQIKKGFLPIHGAMVNVTLKNNQSKNICILGDSGAGKSESLEAFRLIAQDYLKDMKIIFDDMGVFQIKDNQLKAYGTEIGAFVRLDDLDAGYAYKQIDRAIFLNPNQKNSRLVIPVTDYKTIIKGYNVDLFLVANNFEDVEDEIVFFDDIEKAKEAFVKAKRKAKGTTSEEGIVESFFANPFGPVQMQNECEKIIDEYFDFFFKNQVKVGEIYTKLGIENMEMQGPQNAAKKLFDLFE